ncbi:MAG: hypothetical protein NXI18_19900 [Alphaproteobacteria bacterium]|nr:hypothetical protein [Alphaproteobacteria bacterium]
MTRNRDDNTGVVANTYGSNVFVDDVNSIDPFTSIEFGNSEISNILSYALFKDGYSGIRFNFQSNTFRNLKDDAISAEDVARHIVLALRDDVPDEFGSEDLLGNPVERTGIYGLELSAEELSYVGRVEEFLNSRRPESIVDEEYGYQAVVWDNFVDNRIEFNSVGTNQLWDVIRNWTGIIASDNENPEDAFGLVQAIKAGEVLERLVHDYYIDVPNDQRREIILYSHSGGASHFAYINNMSDNLFLSDETVAALREGAVGAHYALSPAGMSRRAEFSDERFFPSIGLASSADIVANNPMNLYDFDTY